MKRLTKTQILKMNSLLIQKTGGSDGIRDEGLLDSALSLLFHNLNGGEDIYKTIQAFYPTIFNLVCLSLNKFCE